MCNKFKVDHKYRTPICFIIIYLHIDSHMNCWGSDEKYFFFQPLTFSHYYSLFACVLSYNAHSHRKREKKKKRCFVQPSARRKENKLHRFGTLCPKTVNTELLWAQQCSVFACIINICADGKSFCCSARSFTTYFY